MQRLEAGNRSVDDFIPFRILGNVSIDSLKTWHGSLPLKARQLLAVLLVFGRRGLSQEQIANYLWGAEPPMSSGQMVRAHIMKLRGVLGDGRARIVHNATVGYSIQISDSDLDSIEFEYLMAQGKRAMAHGDLQVAMRNFHNARAAWRGTKALADVCDILELEAESARLGELLLQTEECLVDAYLMSEQASDIIPSLMSLIVIHPLRERFRIQLMLGLAAAGRPLEAVQFYLTTRRFFVEKVGMEPAAELRRVHGGIIQGEDWLDLLRASVATRYPRGSAPLVSINPALLSVP